MHRYMIHVVTNTHYFLYFSTELWPLIDAQYLMDLIKSGSYIWYFLGQNMCNNKNKHCGRVSCNACNAFISLWLYVLVFNGPGHAKMWLMPYVNNKSADQLAHPRSQISTFVVHCLESMTCMYTCYTQSLKILASFCSWAGRFESYLFENPWRHVFAWCGSNGKNKTKICCKFCFIVQNRNVEKDIQRKKKAPWFNPSHAVRDLSPMR